MDSLEILAQLRAYTPSRRKLGAGLRRAAVVIFGLDSYSSLEEKTREYRDSRSN